MLVGLLYTLFVLLSFLIIFVVLLQRSKGSLGLAGSIGGAQSLFGGSGGQDFFQKLTWFFIGSFMLGSLLLAILKNRSVNQSRYLGAVNPIAAFTTSDMTGVSSSAQTSTAQPSASTDKPEQPAPSPAQEASADKPSR